MYDINVIVNKVACTLVRAKYFSQSFSPPLLKNSYVRPRLRPRAASSPPTYLIRPAKNLAHVFKHHVSDCVQQCNSIGCCLSHKSYPALQWPGNREFRPRLKKFWPPLLYQIKITNKLLSTFGLTFAMDNGSNYLCGLHFCFSLFEGAFHENILSLQLNTINRLKFSLLI